MPVKPEDVIARLGDHKQELRRRYRVASLGLFGSTARHQASESSDVDLVVDFVGEPDFDLFMDLKLRLEELLGNRVDLVTQSGLRGGVKETVERESVRVA